MNVKIRIQWPSLWSARSRRTHSSEVLAAEPTAGSASTHAPMPIADLLSVSGPEPASMPPTAPGPFLSALIDHASAIGTDAMRERSVRQVQPPRVNPSKRSSLEILKQAFSWLRRSYTPAAKKQLRVTETVSLGEKRFIAIIHADGHRFLIGGGATGVSLLTQLGKQPLAVDSHLSIHELAERSA